MTSPDADARKDSTTARFGACGRWLRIWPQGRQLSLWHGYSVGSDLWKSAWAEWLSGDAATKNAGLTLEQIFKAATINNAREFKLDSQLGTIEPGKIANLLLLNKSPLESVDAYDSIVTVWIHGRPVSRESLAADSNK